MTEQERLSMNDERDCICAECPEHPADDLGRVYCDKKTSNADGVCDACRVHWSLEDLAVVAVEDEHPEPDLSDLEAELYNMTVPRAFDSKSGETASKTSPALCECGNKLYRLFPGDELFCSNCG